MIEIDLLDPVSGAKLGKGPLTSASVWRCTERDSRAGVFTATLPASDPKAAQLSEKMIAQAWAMVGGQRSEVGMGIIDTITRTPQADGTTVLEVSGDTIVRELNYRSVRKLKLYAGGLPVSHATALAAVGAYAPSGWVFSADGAPNNNFVYGYFNGESVLNAMVKIAEKCQDHFYRGSGRRLVFTSSFAPSGVRLQQGRGVLGPNAAAIVSLSEALDTYELITRIYPLGTGNAGVELDILPSTVEMPAGYTINREEGYIQNNALMASRGLIESVVRFKDIGPIDPTTPDIVSAADALARAGLEYLKQHSVEIQKTYTVSVSGCTRYLRPLQSVDIAYRDVAAGLVVDARLNLLEVTWQVDSSGFQVTDLKGTTGDRWPKSEVALVADVMADGRVYQVLPQFNANTYVTGYSKHVDNDEVAQFRFRMGNDVTRLRSVYFEFQILPFESTIKSMIPATVSSAGGGASVESAVGAGNHSHTVTIAQHSHTVTIPAHSHTVTIGNHTHTVSIGNHSHTVSLGNHTHTVSIGNHTHTVSVASHTHPVAAHEHSISIAGSSSATHTVVFSSGSGFGFLQKTSAGSGYLNTDSATGATTASSAGAQTPTSGNGSVSAATSGDGGTAVATSGDGGTAVATSGGGSVNAVASVDKLEVVNVSGVQSQTTPSSDAQGQHTHTVTIPSHAHTVTPVLQTVYGIFREEDDRTYTIEHLEYRVNASAWAPLAADATLSDHGWYILDITDFVADIATKSFRPLQPGNLLEVRAISTDAALSGWDVQSGGEVQLYTLTPHGFAVGDSVEIVGAVIGLNGGSNVNGIYEVINVLDATRFWVQPLVPVPPFDFGTVGGLTRLYRTATIDAQLTVGNVIQAYV